MDRRWRHIQPVWLVGCVVVSGCEDGGAEPDLRVIGRLTAGGPLTLAAAREAGAVHTAPTSDFVGLPDATLPIALRVWRRGVDGSDDSCAGRVDVVPLEAYVSSVLPHEWVASWELEALAAGAIAVRSYAVWWQAAGGRYPCADGDDTTWSQGFGGPPDPRTDAAVRATEGMLLTIDGSLILAEYSAEHGSRSDWGVADPPCAVQSRRGHGRGMCQWGSQRWAAEGWSAEEILAHYYPGSYVIGPWDAEIVEVEPYRAMGDHRAAFVQVRNLGVATWTPGAVVLVSPIDGRPPPAVAAVNETVPPGDTAWFEVPSGVSVDDFIELRLEAPDGGLFGPNVLIPADRAVGPLPPKHPQPPRRARRSAAGWAPPVAAGVSVLLSALLAWSGLRREVR